MELKDKNESIDERNRRIQAEQEAETIRQYTENPDPTEEEIEYFHKWKKLQKVDIKNLRGLNEKELVEWMERFEEGAPERRIAELIYQSGQNRKMLFPVWIGIGISLVFSTTSLYFQIGNDKNSQEQNINHPNYTPNTSHEEEPKTQGVVTGEIKSGTNNFISEPITTVPDQTLIPTNE